MPYPATAMHSHISRDQKAVNGNVNILFASLAECPVLLEALTTATASNISHKYKRKLILVQFKSRAFSCPHQPPPLFPVLSDVRQRTSSLRNGQFGRQNMPLQLKLF